VNKITLNQTVTKNSDQYRMRIGPMI